MRRGGPSGPLPPTGLHFPYKFFCFLFLFVVQVILTDIFVGYIGPAAVRKESAPYK